jgi:hypothetical protein
MELSDLRDVHAGETAWVMASGATMNHLDPAFFADKLMVGTNTGPMLFGVNPQFVFTHYHNVAVRGARRMAGRW